MTTIQSLKPHSIASRYPLMQGEAFDTFKTSIRINGQRVPIVLFQGRILDGRNRYRACQELGVAPLVEVFEGTETDAAILSNVLNLDRRHLTREQVREVIVYKIKANPARSDRDIAAEVKVDHKTVATVRRAAAAGGEIPQVSGGPRRVTGRDGKRYQVKGSPTRSAAVAPPGGGASPRSPDESLVATAPAIPDTRTRGAVGTLLVEVTPSASDPGFTFIRVCKGTEEICTRKPIRNDCVEGWLSRLGITPEVARLLMWADTGENSHPGHPWLDCPWAAEPAWKT